MIDRRFDEFLRRGGESPQFQDLPLESKFNPYHDTDDGRFTFGPGGGALAPRERRAESPGMASRVKVPVPGQPTARRPAPSPTPTPSAAPSTSNHGVLSAHYESASGGDPGRVSNPKGDPGGVSYGVHQMSSRKGTVAAFLASPDGSRWSGEFSGLAPGSDEFSRKWQQVAAREPSSFRAAQETYITRTHYTASARSIAKRTGLDIGTRSEALRQVAYSTAVHHGPSGGAAIFAKAVARTDKLFPRNDPRYEASLINGIYDVRTDFWVSKRNAELNIGLKDRARTSNNVVTNRLPDERRRALSLLGGK